MCLLLLSLLGSGIWLAAQTPALPDDSIAYYRGRGDSLGLARAYGQAGVAQYRQRAYEASLAYLDSSLWGYRQLGDSLGVGTALRNQAVVWVDKGAYDRAMALYRESLPLIRAGGDSLGEAQIWSGMGILMANQGRYDTALVLFDRSLAIRQALRDTLAIGKLLGNLGILASYAGNYPQAIAYYEESLRLKEAQGDQKGMANTLVNVGVLYHDQGKTVEAVAAYRRSLALYQALGDQLGIAYVWSNLGITLAAQGDFEAARDAYLQSLAIKEAVGDPKGTANTLHNLGNLFSNHADLDQAAAYHQRALAIRREIGDRNAIAESLMALGSLAQSREALAEATRYYREALAIHQETGDRQGYALTLNNLGNALQQQGRYAEAIPFSREAFAIAEANGDVSDMETMAFRLYTAYRETGQTGPALGMLETYLKMRDSLRSEENQRATLRFAFEQQALQDSLARVQEQAAAELAYTRQLARRNVWVVGALGGLLLVSLWFLYLRARQRQRLREQARDLEQERARQAQLQELDRLKTGFFTNISHEFRTPLTVILGMASQLPPAEAQARKLIQRNGRLLLRLINQVLDLARLETTGLRLNLVQADVVPYLRYLITSLESLAEARQIRLQVKDEVSRLVMDYDPEKVQDIMYNLLSNALKYTPAGGAVTVWLRQTEPSPGQLGLEVAVQDTGPGIDTADLPRIFDRFYQGATAIQDGSTGIGLALVQGLVRMMGGHIEVESPPGAGATFTCWLPVRREAALVEAPAATDEPQPVPRETGLAEAVKAEPDPNLPDVLIIEDNPDVVAYLGAILSPAYNLVTATDGETGLALAMERVPDLVLCDVMMPGRDGFEVTRLLKTDTRTSHIPVILLTAKSLPADRLQGLEHGADAYLTKPFDQAELLVRMAKLLELRRQLQAYYQAQPLRPLAEPEAAPAVKPPSLDDLFLETIRQTVLAGLDRADLSVHDLGEAVHLTRTQVFRKVKALTGLSPTLYIRSLRLQHARHLLETTALNVSEIAYDVGFNDPNYFTRAFVEVYGQTPTQVREASQP